MRIGFDLHGVLDHPKWGPAFVKLTKVLVNSGNEVHILTGKRANDGALAELKAIDAEWTHFFSITDYHESIGTLVENDEEGRPHLKSYIWDKTKAAYAKKEDLDIHFDDSPSYGQYFKDRTVYARIGQRL